MLHSLLNHISSIFHIFGPAVKTSNRMLKHPVIGSINKLPCLEEDCLVFAKWPPFIWGTHCALKLDWICDYRNRKKATNTERWILCYACIMAFTVWCWWSKSFTGDGKNCEVPLSDVCHFSHIFHPAGTSAASLKAPFFWSAGKNN